MCGIHGLINLDTSYFSDGPKYIAEAFVANSLRGMDSSGIFQLDKAFKPFMHKDTKCGSAYINEGVVKTFLGDAARSPLTLCHVRAATVGHVKKENAHPFLVNDAGGKRIIGVHNGTLYNWQAKKGAKDYTVDSNWALSHIAEEGIDAFKDFSGAYCFAWWDENNPTKFQMARNSQRPMHFMISKNKKQLIFGSEAMMVAWLAERNKISVEPEVYSLEEQRLYTFDLDAKEISFTKSADELPRFQGSVMAGYKGQSSIYDEGDWEEYRQNWGGAHGYGFGSGNGGNYYDDDGVPQHGRKMISDLGELLTNSAAELEERKSSLVGEGAIIEVNEDNTLASVTINTTPLRPANDDVPNAYVLPPSHYSTSSAKQDEINAAKSLGVLGELQWLQGVAYDPDNCSVLGIIEDFIPGQGKIQYDAELRMTTASIADRKYINNASASGIPGDWVVVIGATTDQTTNQRLFVVAPLNDEGRRQMMNRRN